MKYPIKVILDLHQFHRVMSLSLEITIPVFRLRTITHPSGSAAVAEKPEVDIIENSPLSNNSDEVGNLMSL